MRNIIISIALFCAYPLVSSAQSSEETAEWLQARISTYYGPSGWAQWFTIDSHEVRDPSGRRDTGSGQTVLTKYKKILAKDVKSVALMKGETSFLLTLSGPVKMCEVPSDVCTDEKSLVIPLASNTSEEERTKIVKAFKHWASNAGAKLVNDDLF